MKIIEQELMIKNDDGTEINTFIVYPQDPGRYPGIFIIHEIWGLNDQIKGVARRYAKEGYVVLAPNLFSRQGEILNEVNIRSAMTHVFSIPREKRNDPSTIKNLMASMLEMERKVIQILFVDRKVLERKIVDDAIVCYQYLKKSNNVDSGKIGITGFCFGGGLAFQLSTLLPLNVSVIFYGANPKPLESVSKINGPVLAIYAGEDSMVDAGISPLVEAMIKYKKTFAMKLYKGVQHAFFNETSSIYDKESAEDAWQMAINYFNKYLKT